MCACALVSFFTRVCGRRPSTDSDFVCECVCARACVCASRVRSVFFVRPISRRRIPTDTHWLDDCLTRSGFAPPRRLYYRHHQRCVVHGRWRASGCRRRPRRVTDGQSRGVGRRRRRHTHPPTSTVRFW